MYNVDLFIADTHVFSLFLFPYSGKQFCSVDRTHTISGRCECSRTHRRQNRWMGVVKKTEDNLSARKATANYRVPPPVLCPCKKRRNCPIHYCECFCSYCIREKALHVKSNESNTKDFCPCSKVDICKDARTCFCRCCKFLLSFTTNTLNILFCSYSSNNHRHFSQSSLNNPL